MILTPIDIPGNTEPVLWPERFFDIKANTEHEELLWSVT